MAGTSDVSPRQVTRRTKALNQVREIVSGGDANKQLQLEVKSFVDTFTLFAACHNKYSRKYLSEATISTLGKFFFSRNGRNERSI